MQIFERYDTEFWKNWHMVMNKEWKSYDEWNSDRADPVLSPARLATGTYFSGIGVLVKRGLLPLELILDLLGSPVVFW
jgi:hypothetical protein